MKTPQLLFCLFLLGSSPVSAQWQYNGTKISYNNGNVGIGLGDPVSVLQLHSSDNPTLAIGRFNTNTNGKSSLVFFAGDATLRNAFSVQYMKTASADRLAFTGGSGLELLSIFNNGNIGIGTLNPDYKLTVNGKIKAEEVQVVVDVPADYVFEAGYQLMSLSEVARYVAANKHLPNVPSADEIRKNGWLLGEMGNTLLEKIEELTLYLIQLKNENEALKARIEKLEQK